MANQPNNISPTPAFKCIENWTDLENSVNNRRADPYTINQSQTPLCGPAAFMFCIAKSFPQEYYTYVKNLALNGEARIGNLHVKPSKTCTSVNLGELIKMKIDPADWIALASLRDSSNSILPVNAGSLTAGITTPASLKEWFSSTGLFSNGVGNNASIVQSKGLNKLIKANQQYRTGAFVCLMVRAAIIGGNGGIGIDKIGKNTPKTLVGTPDHWIVMDSDMRLGKPPANLMPHSVNFPKQNKLELEKLSFRAYTWGDTQQISRDQAQEFFPYFYGFVNAST